MEIKDVIEEVLRHLGNQIGQIGAVNRIIAFTYARPGRKTPATLSRALKRQALRLPHEKDFARTILLAAAKDVLVVGKKRLR